MLRLTAAPRCQHWAARNGHLDVCDWLVSAVGTSPDVPTHDGTTPFQLAVWQGRLDVCEWLLARGVNVHQAKPRGRAPPPQGAGADAAGKMGPLPPDSDPAEGRGGAAAPAPPLPRASYEISANSFTSTTGVIRRRRRRRRRRQVNDYGCNASHWVAMGGPAAACEWIVARGVDMVPSPLCARGRTRLK